MANRNEIIQFINELLLPENFNDLCVNGLQVEGQLEINKIVIGVSVSERFIQKAIEAGANMIILHHGLLWKSDPHPLHITGILYRRLRLLIENGINLAGYHLPLDAHPEIGNNAQIIQRLGLQQLDAVDVGFVGEYTHPIPFDEFHKRVDETLSTKSFVLPYGQPEVKRVLAISGGSSPAYKQALAVNADTFISGDIRENLVRNIEEVQLNYLNAGHYNTERFGIQTLGQKIREKFTIPCEFIDIPNPV